MSAGALALAGKGADAVASVREGVRWGSGGGGVTACDRGRREGERRERIGEREGGSFCIYWSC